MNRFFEPFRYLVFTGNYGSGKTEISLNMARVFCKEQQTTLVDLDIVNPYFRSGEKAAEAEAEGIRMLMPTFALTTVDIPALPPAIQSVFETPAEKVIFDVGGDDTGAAALGRYYPSFMDRRRETLVAMVINCMRPLTETKENILDLADRIQCRGRLKIDLLINNTNLAGMTTPGMVENGEKTVLDCAENMGIEKVCTAGISDIIEQCTLKTPAITIQRYMIPEWMEQEK